MLLNRSIYMPPVEIPGWGHISGETLQDAAIEAERILIFTPGRRFAQQPNLQGFHFGMGVGVESAHGSSIA